MADKKVKKTNVFGADWTCPKCGHTNPEAIDDCQWCKFLEHKPVPPIQQEPPNPHGRRSEFNNKTIMLTDNGTVDGFEAWEACAAAFRPLMEQAERENARLKEELRFADKNYLELKNNFDERLESQLSKLQARPEQAREKLAGMIMDFANKTQRGEFIGSFEFADQILQLFPFPDEQGIRESERKAIWEWLEWIDRVNVAPSYFNQLWDKGLASLKAGEPPQENK